jgi:hypothetical protein
MKLMAIRCIAPFIVLLNAFVALGGASPSLSVSQTTSSIEISWPAALSGYALEVTSDLKGSSTWRLAPTNTTLVGSALHLVVLATDVTSFFRLRSLPVSLPGTNFQIGEYELVRSNLFSPGIVENTYTATVSNWSAEDALVSATVDSLSGDITVLPNVVDFGETSVGDTVHSSNTFTVRFAADALVDLSALVWTIHATALAPTSFALIDAARTAGSIDEETALIYKIYVEFDESLLPAAFRGRDDQFQEARAINALRDRFDTLSPATQQLLVPFLMQPNTPGSWYYLKQARKAAAGASTLAGKDSTKSKATAAAPPTVILWDKVDTANGKVRIWWDSERKSSLEAQKLANEIDTTIWPKLTGLLGEPKPDTDHSLLQPNFTEIPDETDDERLDIFLTDSQRVYTAVRSSCRGNTQAAFIDLGVHRSFSSLVHELTHAILYRFPLQTLCDNTKYRWLHDATAEWAKQFVYPKVNDEWSRARLLLDHPELPLDFEEAGGPEFYQHPYGAYLWFLFLTRGSDSGAHFVRETWDACASHDSRGAIAASIQALGGFRSVWPDFALYNWNRLSGGKPYRYYFTWDDLNTRAREMTPEPVKVKLNGASSRTYPLTFGAPNLSAVYFHYDFTEDQTVRSLTFSHPYSDGSEPSARVQAIVRYRGQDWKEAEDWTGFAQKKLCRDLPSQDFEQLIIVISNSESVNRDKILGILDDVKLQVSVFGCDVWQGSITQTYDLTTPGVTETKSATANVVFAYDDAASEGGAGFPQIYTVQSGDYTYSRRLDFDFGGAPCRILETSVGLISPNPYRPGIVWPTVASLTFIPGVIFPGETGVHFTASGGSTISVTQLDNCGDMEVTTVNDSEFTWWTSTDGEVSADGKTIDGHKDGFDDQGGAFHWAWHLTRN